MGRGKEPEQQSSNPIEAKKFRDEASGHFKSGHYERALVSLNKVTLQTHISSIIYFNPKMFN